MVDLRSMVQYEFLQYSITSNPIHISNVVLQIAYDSQAAANYNESRKNLLSSNS